MDTRISRRILQTALLGLGLAASLAYAAAYKWVDEQGVTHFSQFPPTGRQVETIATPKSPPADNAPTSPSPAAEPAAKAPDQPPADGTPKTEAEAKQQLAAVRQENCRRARANLNTLTTGGRLRYTDAEGTVRYLSDEERAQRVEEAQKQIEQYCTE